MADHNLSHSLQAHDEAMRFFRNQYYSPGELARVRQLVRKSGTSMILPYDQFIEHDNRHASINSDGTDPADPNYIVKLAVEGGYNAVAVHYGVAKRYWARFSGAVPLLVKLNGKTSIPSQSTPLSVHTSYVEDAVRLGAVAVGYTMYYGSPRQGEDLVQLGKVRKECDRYGMPLVVWAYPRGEAVDRKGGKESSYLIESATRMAVEMGATIIKANLPVAAEGDFVNNNDVPKEYRKIEGDLLGMEAKAQKWERAKRVVQAAQGVPVLFSGGSEIDDSDLMDNAQACVDAGAFGFIFGRNMWKRPNAEALRITNEFGKMLDSTAK